MEHADLEPVRPRLRRKSSSYALVKTRHTPIGSGQSPAQRTARVGEVLNSEYLKGVDKGTSRTMSLTDDFESHVLDAAKVVKKYWESYQNDHATLKRRRGIFKKSSEQVTDELMIAKFQVLRNNAQRWLNSRDKKGDGDAKRQEKKKACEDFVQMARLGIEEVSARKLSDRAESLYEKCESGQQARPELVRHRELCQKLKEGSATREEQAEFRASDAKLGKEVYGDKDPPDGTTEGMKLIRGEEGYAYAFKPAKGESSQMRTPPGAGTVREVMASRFFDEIDKQCNLNFRWPKTTIATVYPDGKSGGPGALIEGMPGTPCDDIADKSLFKKVPKEAVQKLLLGNLASLQLDAKLGNVFIDTSGDPPDIRPSDGGALAPSGAMLADQVAGKQNVIGSVFVDDFGGKVFDEPIADEIRMEFLKIKVSGIQNALDDEKLRCLGAGYDADALEVGEGCDQMLEAVTALQDLLTGKPKITARELMMEFHNTFVLPKAVEARRLLLLKHEDDLQAVCQRYPDLVPTFEQYIEQPGPTDRTKEDLWDMIASPKEQPFLARLASADPADFTPDRANIKLPLRVRPSLAFKRLEDYLKKRQA